jgi:hypothetical protein
MSERNLQDIMSEVRLTAVLIRRLHRDIALLDPTQEHDDLVPTVLRDNIDQGLSTLQRLTDEAVNVYYDR